MSAINPFLAEFKMYVFAPDQSSALRQVDVWRGLATGMGFEPGPGRVSQVRDGDLGPIQAALDRARAKALVEATPFARGQAISTLAAHFDGDGQFATELVESIEAELGGKLPAAIAKALAAARPQKAAA